MKTTREQAIAELKGMIKHISDGYCCHLAHGGKADSQVETELDALHFAVNALESRYRKNQHRQALIYKDVEVIPEGIQICPNCGRK